MIPGLEDHAFRDEHWERLDAVGTIVDRRAARARSTTTAPARCWPRPTCCSVTGAARRSPPRRWPGRPKLRLFAYAAGTVKWQVVDAVWDRDLIVTSAAAANAVPVAEYTVAMIVLANKGVPLFAARERDPDANVPLTRHVVEPGQEGRAGRRIAGGSPRHRAAAQLRPRGGGGRPVPRSGRGRPAGRRAHGARRAVRVVRRAQPARPRDRLDPGHDRRRAAGAAAQGRVPHQHRSGPARRPRRAAGRARERAAGGGARRDRARAAAGRLALAPAAQRGR